MTLQNLRVTGYKVGVLASKAPALTVDHADLSGSFRQRLEPIPKSEDESDWLHPHDNDHDEWMARYGAALVLKDSAGATLAGIRVRRGQNGIGALPDRRPRHPRAGARARRARSAAP